MSTAVPPAARTASPVPVERDGRTSPGQVVADLRVRMVLGCLLFAGLLVVGAGELVVHDGGRWPAWLPPVLAAPAALWVALPVHRAALAGLRRRVLAPDALVSLGTVALLAQSVEWWSPATEWSPVARSSAGAAAGVATLAIAVRWTAARARRHAEARPVTSPSERGGPAVGDVGDDAPGSDGRLVSTVALTVLGVAVTTLAVHHLLGTGPAASLGAAVAVLVAGCPGALVLAGPPARLGTGDEPSARADVVRRIDTVLVDRASLTDGDPEVLGVVPAVGEDVDEILTVAGALEAAASEACASEAAASGVGVGVGAAEAGTPGAGLIGAGTSGAGAPHPVARAIADHARAWVGPAADVRHLVPLPGRGLRGTVTGRDAMIGAPRLITDHGLVAGPDLGHAVRAAELDGRVPLVVAWDGRARAVLIITETPRPTAAGAVAELRELGVEPMLVTGGNALAARALAGRVGIVTVVGEALPEDKVGVVRALRARGRVVAVIGDGTSEADAPVLAAADLGITTTPGSDTLVAAITAGRRALAVDAGRRRLVLAHHVVALPLAAVGLLPPLAAGAAAAATSAVVLAAAGRRRRANPRVSYGI